MTDKRDDGFQFISVFNDNYIYDKIGNSTRHDDNEDDDECT